MDSNYNTLCDYSKLVAYSQSLSVLYSILNPVQVFEILP